MMRIVAGEKRGKKLCSLPGENTRPTLERVKQAFFNAIQFEIAGRTALDLFSGSGQLGLEALSRGADFCFFNDNSEKACEIIDKNIKLCNFSQISQLTCKSYTECVKIIKSTGRRVSLVFLDPPYGCGLIDSALAAMTDADILEDGAILVCESARNDTVSASGFKLRREYVYSEIKITILERGCRI